MSKGIMICFRTCKELRNAIEVIANEEKRSVSSIIEKILCSHLEQKKRCHPEQQENRRYPRKTLTAPALISEGESKNTASRAGIVMDISLAGLQISIPDYSPYELRDDGETSRISIVFALPECTRPLTMQCVPKHIFPSGGETRIGASLVDADFASYQALQKYLAN